jgi:diadenosine tetraphosphate (Ap4A) HIT family hydrolase
MTATETWRLQREQVGLRVQELRRQGICDTCHSLATGEPHDNRYVIHEDDLFKVNLEAYPRSRGHTIVVYKPHRADFSELAEDETGRVFQMCVRIANAVKHGLGAEKVYLNTMCDGPLNHLHLQLFPRYAGDPIGSTRFVAPRGPLIDGDETIRLIRAALMSGQT